jgi:ribose 1,5-bisphosphokinase PhnN
MMPTSGREPVALAWRADHYSGGVRYRIDREHPAVKAVLAEAGAALPQIRAMLRVIEETIPVQRIWLDTAEAKETPRTGFAAEPDPEVRAVAEVLFRNMTRKGGLTAAEARARLLRTEPFHLHPNLIASLADDAAGGGGD